MVNLQGLLETLQSSIVLEFGLASTNGSKWDNVVLKSAEIMGRTMLFSTWKYCSINIRPFEVCSTSVNGLSGADCEKLEGSFK